MSRFTFRLQSVLTLRLSQRDEKRRQLAEAVQAENVLQKQSQLIDQEIAGTKTRARTVVSPGRVDVDDLLNSHRYNLLLSAQRQQLQRQMEQLTVEIQRRRDALTEADRDVRSLEKLYEKQLAAHRQGDAAREMRVIDEAAQRMQRRAP